MHSNSYGESVYWLYAEGSTSRENLLWRSRGRGELWATGCNLTATTTPLYAVDQWSYKGRLLLLPFTTIATMSYWPLLVYFLYGLATVINTFAALSLPYAPAPYTYIAEIQFNEKWFNGSVNGMPVQNLSIIRVSLATFCPTWLISFLTCPVG